MPALGVNALQHACTFVHLATTTLSPILAQRRDENVVPAEARQASLAFTVLQAGSNVNTVPAQATVAFDRRLVPGETLDGARNEITGILEQMKGMTGMEGLRYEYIETYATEAVRVDPAQPIAAVFQDAIQTVTGRQAGIVISPGSDDQVSKETG